MSTKMYNSLGIGCSFTNQNYKFREDEKKLYRKDQIPWSTWDHLVANYYEWNHLNIGESGRGLDWMDFINGVCYRLKEEINQTLEIDLKDYEFYENQLPSIPSQDTFYETSWADDRFDKSSDTLDINGGEEDIGEDKRSI